MNLLLTLQDKKQTHGKDSELVTCYNMQMVSSTLLFYQEITTLYTIHNQSENDNNHKNT